MKNVVITGGSSGIGYATTKMLIEKGYNVYVLDLKPCDIKETKTLICDVTNEKQVVNSINLIPQIDVLINCAGIFGCYYVEDTPQEYLDRLIDTNLKGYFLVTKHALPKLKQTKGNIVNVSSGIGINADPTCPAYCMTKTGINALTKCLAISQIKEGIRVNAVLPGPINTPLLAEWFSSEEEIKEYQELNPQNKIGNPEDVAKAILFLCDENNNYINGSFLAIDGGESISSYLPQTIKYVRKTK